MAITETKPLRVNVRLRNNRLLTLREVNGLSQQELARAVHVNVAYISLLERFGCQSGRKVSVSTPKMSGALERLARFFGVPVEELAPPDLYEAIGMVETERELAPEEAGYFLDMPEEMLALPSPEDEIISKVDGSEIRKFLATLTPREEQILRLLYGIGEERSWTLAEIGDRFQISGERVRGIAEKAETKLRHRLRMAGISPPTPAPTPCGRPGCSAQVLAVRTAKGRDVKLDAVPFPRKDKNGKEVVRDPHYRLWWDVEGGVCGHGHVWSGWERELYVDHILTCPAVEVDWVAHRKEPALKSRRHSYKRAKRGHESACDDADCPCRDGDG